MPGAAGGGALSWRWAGIEDLGLLARLNRELHEAEGSPPAPLPALCARLRRWLGRGYRAVVFQHGTDTVAYGLFRATDADREGDAARVFLQQFLVCRAYRGQGLGRPVFAMLREEVLPAGARVLLDALSSNPAGQRFWEAQGFHALSTRYELPVRRRR